MLPSYAGEARFNDGQCQAPPKYDEEFEETLAEVKEAKRLEEDARNELGEMKRLLERDYRFAFNARKRQKLAASNEQEALRMAQQAEQKKAEARRKDTSTHRAEGNVLRWSAQAKKAVADQRKLEDEVRRKELDSKDLTKKMRFQEAELAQRIKASHKLKQRLKFLARGVGPAVEEALFAEAEPVEADSTAAPALTITEQRPSAPPLAASQVSEALDRAKATHRDARQLEEGTRTRLGKARRRHQLAQSVYDRARGDEARARERQGDARSRAEQARKSGQDADQWDSEALRADRDLRRWADETWRKERGLSTLDVEVKSLAAEFENRVIETQVMEEILDALEGDPDGFGSSDQETIQVKFEPLTVTERAAAALEDLLKKLNSGPDRLLRLETGADDQMALVLDEKRAGDRVIKHRDNPVLLVPAKVPKALFGKTLDISNSTKGPQITLSV